MTTFSSSSRLANFRQKKNNQGEESHNTNEGQLKLTLPAQNDDKPAYEPTSTFNNTRTSMRLLKGKIQRKQSIQKQGGLSKQKSDLRSTQTNLESQPKLTLDEKPAGLKLVINDSPQIVEKKSIPQPPPKPPQKRIMIKKQQPKEQPKKQEPKEEIPPKKVEQREEIPIKKQQYVNKFDEKPIIREEDIEQSKEQPETQNDLVICPEGCGRKFNRKALEKHAKACKIVFMSKRKEFNSEAKRITSKEQANIVKQNKQKQKAQFGKTKSKGFDKTGDNWKAASQDFRAAIKAVKKQDENQEGEGAEHAQQNMKLVECQYCEKKFAHMLIQKHHENCIKKKQKDNKKRTTKKK